MIYIYLIYGLSFFILWIVLWIYHMRIGQSALARNLWMIALFALSHGTSDWISMLLFVQNLENPPLKIVSLLFLAASFYFLLQFGVSSIGKRLLNLAPAILFVLLAAIVALSSRKFVSAEIFSRYLLGIPGGLLTYYALILKIPQIQNRGNPGLVRSLKLSSTGFLFYGFFAGLIVPKAEFFPASVLNASSFQSSLGVPVELFRAVFVLLIAFSMTRALHQFELEAINSIRRAKDELEERVRERTGELNSLNQVLRERERQQKAILDNIPDIAWLKDREGRFIAVNEAFAKSSNISSQNLIGKTDLDVWPKELAERYMADDREVIESARGKRVEEPLADKDGTGRWIETIKTPIYNERGEVIGTTGIARDITERKRIEAALTESEERYRVTAENAQDAIITIDEDNTILFVNPAAEKIFGYSSPEMYGLPFTMLMPERLRESHLTALKKHRVSGKRMLPAHAIELPGLRRDGGEIPLEISFGEYIQKGKHFFIGIIRDITERKRAEGNLRKREKDLSNITSNLAEGIYVIGEKGDILFMNPEAERLLGWTIEELNAKNPHEIVHFRRADGSPLPFEECNMARVLKTGERFSSTDEVFVRKDGTAFPISVISAPIIEEGKVTASVTAFQDITGLKRAEEEIRHLNEILGRRAVELETAYKDLEGFAYAVSHDLKAPIIRIKGFADIASEDYADKLDEHGRDLLKRISDNAARMKALIEDLLDYSRFGAKTVNKTDIDINIIIKNVYDEVKPAAGERDLRLTVSPMPKAFGDPFLLRQVIFNLLSNAVKFTRKRKTGIVEVGGYSEQDENIYFVRDNGIGFDMQFADRLFGLFQRVHISKDFEGTGVGLVIVKKIIKKHGGRVWAEGVPDQGATFYFSLPKKSE